MSARAAASDDKTVSALPQRVEQCRVARRFEAHVIRLQLVVHARRVDGRLRVEALGDEATQHLRHRRRYRRAAAGADGEPRRRAVCVVANDQDKQTPDAPPDAPAA